MTEGGGIRHVALQDVRRQLALTEDEKMDLIESVEGEAYTVKLQYIANEGDSVIIPHNFTIVPPAIAWPTVEWLSVTIAGMSVA